MDNYMVTQTVVYTWYTKALDAEDALTNFARLVLELPLTEDIDWRNMK